MGIAITIICSQSPYTTRKMNGNRLPYPSYPIFFGIAIAIIRNPQVLSGLKPSHDVKKTNTTMVGSLWNP